MKLHLAAALSLCFLNASAFAASKARIASFVDVIMGGDIGQYEETKTMHRNETRQMYMHEVVDAALALSQGMFDPGAYLSQLQQIQDIADGKRAQNAKIDEAGIGVSAGELLKAEIENLYQVNQITATERKIEFASVLDEAGGKVKVNKKANFDHFISMNISHMGHGYFNIVATLHSDKGQDKTFNGIGSIETAIQVVAERIFKNFMTDERPAWVNPNEGLVWIQGPSGDIRLDEQGALSYCAGQNARLPYADELIQAQLGTGYRHGGIASARPGEIYFIKDLQRQGGVKMVLEVLSDKGTKLNVTGANGRRGKVWCVMGQVSERNQFIQKLFSMRRGIDPLGKNIQFYSNELSPADLGVIKAIESLLVAVGAPGAQAGVTIRTTDLLEPTVALGVLERSGFSVVVPESVANIL